MARNNDSNKKKSRQSNKNQNQDGQKMSREEAGRLGGLAPHSCRGRECNEDNSSNSQGSNKSKSNR